MKLTIFSILIVSIIFPCSATSPFLKEKGHGSITYTYATGNWKEFDDNTGKVKPGPYGDSSIETKERSHLIYFDYGLSEKFSFDLQTGYVESELPSSSPSPSPDNNGRADVTLGLRYGLISPYGGDSWSDEAPFFLTVRLGATLPGSYDADSPSSGKPLLNLPANGDRSMDFSLLPAWVSENEFWTISGEASYLLGMRDSNNITKLRIYVSENVHSRVSLFQFLGYHRSTGGFENGMAMMQAAAVSGVLKTNRLNEQYSIWNIGLTLHLPHQFSCSIYGGSKFGHRINTSVDAQNINVSITKSF